MILQYFLVLVAFLLCLPISAAWGKADTPQEAARYQLYEGFLDDSPSEYKNPFDAREVSVDAVFTSDKGTTVKIPCFYDDYSSGWKVRFASAETGAWKYYFLKTDAKGKKTNRPGGTVNIIDKSVTPYMKGGYIARAEGSRYFSFTEGGTYIPIGSNAAWEPSPGYYEQWFYAMARAGANFARVWFSPQGGYGLEGPEEDGYPGLGRYNELNAGLADSVVKLGERSGIRIEFTIGSYRELIDEDSWGPAGWPKSPYNAANGGPCKTAKDFWTSSEAKAIYKNRLRYIVARYGYSPAIMAWELWNEVDAPKPWVEEMASYIKSIDPYHHLISTTYGTKAIWELPQIDFTQTHIYRTGDLSDMTGLYSKDAADHLQYGKPHLLAEFGIDWRASDSSYDPQGKGTNFRKGIWASFLSGSSGSGMLWWWDNYIAPQNMYHVFTPFAKFVRDLPWDDSVKPMKFEIKPGSGDRTLYDIDLIPDGGWGAYSKVEFRVGPDGVDRSNLPSHLYGPSKAPWNTALELKLNAPRDTVLTLGVHDVSANNHIEVAIDGKVAWTKDFTPGAGEGEWKASQYKEEWKIYQATYDKDYEIAFPAGEHLVSIKNTAGDWVNLSHIGLKAYTPVPPVAAMGLSGQNFACFFIHDLRDTWKADKLPNEKGLLMAINDSELTQGTYRVEWIDTSTGGMLATDTLTIASNTVQLPIPDFRGDAACRLIRQ